MPDTPDLGGRSDAARSWFQGRIVFVFLALLVLIPVEEILRTRPWSREGVPAPALSPAVSRDGRACLRGDTAACHRASFAYAFGKGAPMDADRAALYLDLACSLGDRSACPGGR